MTTLGGQRDLLQPIGRWASMCGRQRAWDGAGYSLQGAGQRRSLQGSSRVRIKGGLATMLVVAGLRQHDSRPATSS